MAKDREAVKDIFASQRKLTATDLDVLRQNMEIIPSMTGLQGDWLSVRMQVELIDAIRSLDETSTKLINTTNRLTKVMLIFTIVGVVVGAAGILVAVFHRGAYVSPVPKRACEKVPLGVM